MKIYFVTTSPFKVKEIQSFVRTLNCELEICHVKEQLEEPLCLDIDTIVRHKALEAFKYLSQPCVVEHSGLLMEVLPGMPGGLGSIIWNAIGDRMCSFLREGDKRNATAQSFIGYCNGRKVTSYRGETPGQIAKCARGDYNFNWDPIFIPKGSKRTYGEMEPHEKRATSPAIKAWAAFLKQEFPDCIRSSKKT
jgi:XTP/dITP diphosphohydrolase